MDKLSEKITGMLNSGQSAIDISEYFGGIIPMLKKCKQDPQLIRLLQKKLLGNISGVIIDRVGGNVDTYWKIPFIVTSVDEDDGHYHVGVNLLIPELKSSQESEQVVYDWLEEYLADNGSESGTFTDKFLSDEMCWVSISHINGKSWKQFNRGNETSDEEFLELLPDKYFY
jgi:hypothetical protein